MKKYISLFAAIVMLLSAVGCSNRGEISELPESGGTGSSNGTTAGTDNGTESPSTTATEAYTGLEIVTNGGAAEEVRDSDKESGGIFDDLFSFGDDAAGDVADGAFAEDFAYAAEGAEEYFAPAEAPSATAGGYDSIVGGEIGVEPEPWIEPDIPEIEPQAGLLTGGEWSDNDNWHDWVSLYQTHDDWNEYRDIWRITFDDRVSVKVTTDDGTPVEGAEVSCESFSAITDNNGMAYLFYAEENAPEEITVTYKEIQKELEVSEGDDELECSLGNLALSQEKYLDLMLMVDTTGSMTDELAYLQAELQDVVERAAQENGNIPIRVSVNFYRDEGDEYIVRYYPFTTDVELAVETIGEQYAMGGGDFPEAVHSALDIAVNEHEWSENSTRLMFFVLDAPPHKDAQIVDNVNSLTAQAAAEGIRIIPVASSGIDKSTEYLLRTMAFTTGGTYTFLTDHSGIGGSHIEPTIGDYQLEMLNDMMVRIIGDYLE